MAITTDELNTQAEKIAELRSKEAEAALVKKAITEELEAAENKMVEMLTEADLRNYRAPAGLASLSFRTSVKTPKTPADKDAFYNYLRDKGIYDAMISVNSQKLNSFYKEELAIARNAGLEDFNIPGITEVTINPILSFTRPK